MKKYIIVTKDTNPQKVIDRHGKLIDFIDFIRQYELIRKYRHDYNAEIAFNNLEEKEKFNILAVSYTNKDFQDV
jgi:alpha-D-ribose 1-methylphosphonate 5-triphosphate synthase subunit PhnI